MYVRNSITIATPQPLLIPNCNIVLPLVAVTLQCSKTAAAVQLYLFNYNIGEHFFCYFLNEIDNKVIKFDDQFHTNIYIFIYCNC